MTLEGTRNRTGNPRSCLQASAQIQYRYNKDVTGEHGDLDISSTALHLSQPLRAAVARFETLRREAASPIEGYLAWMQTPEGRAQRVALRSKQIPHYASCMQAVLTRRGLASLIRRRYRAQLAKLSPARRRSWTTAYSESLIRDYDPEERFGQLFVTSEKEGTWDVEYLLNRDGRRMRLLRRSRPAKPGFITLKGFGQATTRLSIDMPLPDIVQHVETFVKLQRSIFSVKVPRGRKKGDTGARIDAAPAAFLAYLADRHRQRKSDLLRLVDRDTTADNYRWLERRLLHGRQYLRRHSWFTDILETHSVQDIWALARVSALSGQRSAED